MGRVGVVRWLAAGVLLSTAPACSATGPGPDRPDAAGQTATAPAVTPTTSGPATARPVSPSAAGGFTLVATGDVLIHPPLTEQAARDARAAGRSGYDFRPIFAGVAPLIRDADLAICHLETPLAAPGGPFRGYPAFSAPPQVAAALASTGYDACSTASNHVLDQGRAGVRRTLDALDRAAIRHTGSARSAREAAAPAVLRVRGAEVAQLSYTFGFNGFTLPAGSPWLANRLDPARILAAARRARSAGADVVVVSLHWGDEFRHEPTAQQRSVARRLLDSPDIDLILGHHAHVVQPFERIGEKWVAYGLGNHLARHARPRGRTEESVIARFSFAQRAGRWRVTKAEYLPVLTDLGPPIRLVDLGSALAAQSATQAPRARYQAAYERIRETVRSRGAARAGLVEPR